MRIKHVCSHITDGSHFSPPTTLIGKHYVTVSDVRDNQIYLDEAKFISESDFNELVKNGCKPQIGDVLLTKDGTVGRTAVVSESDDYVVLSSLGILRPNSKVSSKMLKYAIDCDNTQQTMKNAMEGSALRRITISKIKEFPITIPSDKETQDAIVSYLDKKCSAIDEGTEKHKKIIEKLEEYQKATIVQLTTKGINNDCLIGSNIDIIGDIPVSWSLKRLKYLCDITTGDSDTQDCNPDGAYPFYVRSPIVERSNHVTFNGEGILMAGDGAGAGRIFHLAHGKYAVHQRVYRLYNFREIVPEYLIAFLSVKFPDRMNQGSAMSTVPSVRLPMLKDFVVPIPSSNEQLRIVNEIRFIQGKISESKRKHEELITKLEEYRKSIIYNAVTGKIDCREAM